LGFFFMLRRNPEGEGKVDGVERADRRAQTPCPSRCSGRKRKEQGEKKKRRRRGGAALLRRRPVQLKAVVAPLVHQPAVRPAGEAA
jgi:hypothetical protein